MCKIVNKIITQHRPTAHQLRVHTQPKFINHEALADNLLNLGQCTATGFLLPWKQYLTNTNEILELVLMRMEKDWLSTGVKQRRPWNSKDLEPWSQLHTMYFYLYRQWSSMHLFLDICPNPMRKKIIDRPIEFQPNQGPIATGVCRLPCVLGTVQGSCATEICWHSSGWDQQGVPYLNTSDTHIFGAC